MSNSVTIEKKIIDEFENRTGYVFKNKKLILEALTHSSYANELKINKRHHNERLEFLGDAVLEIVSSEYIYINNPDMPEGDMTKLRASYVCEPTLALCAREFNLGELLFLGHGEENTGGRQRDSILSDALEATIGAVYLDSGFEDAKAYIHRLVLNDVENKALFYDSKTILQEFVQKKPVKTLEYKVIKEEGPDHNKSFEVATIIDGEEVATGRSHTKKKAEMEAAYKTILILRKK